MELEKLDAWRPLLAEELKKPYFAALAERVDAAYETQTVFPPREELFTAFELTPPEAVRVVILGQDPYHEPGQAHGLAFSVRRGVKLPPSLRNIYQELESDLGISPAKDGDLSAWARQGVLLLNTVLTVRAHQPNSHKGKGWEILTDRIISELNHKTTPVVFLLWGANARSKKKLITNPQHVILETVHPSPLSAYGGFFGCRHFSQANRVLEQSGQVPIDWTVR